MVDRIDFFLSSSTLWSKRHLDVDVSDFI